MRILSYNILDGGARREDALSRVIESQRPDVVALVEADDPAVAEWVAGRLGMDFIHAPGHSHASALLSRLPIARTVNHALLRRGLEKSLLEATVLREDKTELTFGVAHLHARAFEVDEDIRERELNVVLDVFAPHRAAGVAHVLCGDFNSNAPYQQIDPAKCKAKTRKAWDAQGGTLPRRVVQRLLDAGYRDTLHTLDRLQGETGATFTTEHPGQRVDYIFTHGIATDHIKRAWIGNEPPAKDASDHFPVGVELV